jgi:AcrR family transcriptional regulator
MPSSRQDPVVTCHERLDDIRMMRQSGMEMTDIAKAIGISTRSLYRAKEKDSLVRQALKLGTAELLLKLEDSMYRAAMGGYSITKSKKIYIPDRNDPSKLVLERVEEWTEEQTPNAGLMVFALKNLSNGKFIDKREYTDTSDFGNNIGMLKSILKENEVNGDQNNKNNE